MSLSDRFRQSSNPLLSEERLAKASSQPLDGGVIQRSGSEVMTVDGAVNKTFLLGALLLVTAVYSFFFPSQLFMWGGALGGLAIVLVMSFKPQMSGTLAPIYSLLEGLFVGSVTAIYAAGFGTGLVFNAILGTISVLFMMLFIYKAGIITVNQKFRSGMMMALGAVFLVYMINIVLGFFGMSIPFLHQGGPIGIGISVVIIGIASLMLLLDFDSIERGAEMRAPKYMEWFTAVGLIVTLVWLYLEILRLLAVLNRD
ncbi:putative YccA/Bax inhibitor family protein [Neolewinella xylanilytica]|uniref:Putative YccA/Bax inhibitor family protein n=1 Tax=Neolewinella xylanilytica TaxID=1514080 RepID=A0A2S6I210_9BACT|nr:Bax inhibitor-1/YccA family protein [Neolewinella xylanilytica]PPK85212.1 putative YccA/Bax inhibitor family protein [Neolewinella xylanilytica]